MNIANNAQLTATAAHWHRCLTIASVVCTMALAATWPVPPTVTTTTGAAPLSSP